MSSYRYEGVQVNDSTARSEARTLGTAIRTSNKKNLTEDDKIVRMLTIRSKLHLKAVVKFYKELYGRDIYKVYKQQELYHHKYVGIRYTNSPYVWPYVQLCLSTFFGHNITYNVCFVSQLYPYRQHNDRWTNRHLTLLTCRTHGVNICRRWVTYQRRKIPVYPLVHSIDDMTSNMSLSSTK